MTRAPAPGTSGVEPSHRLLQKEACLPVPAGAGKRVFPLLTFPTNLSWLKNTLLEL